MTRTPNVNQCASCGKADANLKACGACMMVLYCSVECQLAHRSTHKASCKKRAAELFDAKLFAQPPPKEECPICMITLPFGDDEESAYMSCCGKFICHGCTYYLTRDCCPFCNTAGTQSDEEFIKRLSDRMEKYNDPDAMVMLGNSYHEGQNGLTVDQSKAFELLQRASELGSAMAHYNLGCLYFNGLGVQVSKKKAIHHWQIAAMMGQLDSRYNLGMEEIEKGDYQRAMMHFMIAAKCGCKDSLDIVKKGFRQGYVTKEDFEKTLRDYYQAAYEETKSEQRDRAAAIKARARE
eukprot:scaffold22984_cov26-Cyclotella_meneghiniana.AAC.2